MTVSAGEDARPLLDAASREWLAALTATGPARVEAIERLHALLLRAARFQLARRAWARELRGESLDDLAAEAAGDALVAILARLDDFRGESRFTTWASKFVFLEAAVALRRRTWKERELPVDWNGWEPPASDASGPEAAAEGAESIRLLRDAVRDVLTERQRDVFVAVALNGAPIDVVAERLGSTRGAVYKTLHDARQKLRAHLGDVRTDRPAAL